jgi:polar amino acid transport system substrate-binding protein
MNPCESPRAKRGAKLFGLAATILMVCGLALAVPARADRNQCAPGGTNSATA